VGAARKVDPKTIATLGLFDRATGRVVHATIVQAIVEAAK
jgi:hypothetical protein